MMNISDELRAHLRSANPTIAFCLSITRTDGESYHITSHDVDISYGGNIYSSQPGVDLTEIRSTLGLNVDNLDHKNPYFDGFLERLDMLNDLYRGATFQLFFLNYNDTSMGIGIITKGTIGKITIEDFDFEIELRSLSQALQQDVGKRYTPYCQNDLGLGICGLGVDLADYTYTGSVDTATSQKEFTCIDLNPALTDSNRFRFGYVTWTSGNNIGKKSQVRIHTYADGVHTIELFYDMFYEIQADDGFTAVFGCDKDMNGDCLNVFDNVINFFGFPAVPGKDVFANMDVQGKY